MAQILDNQDKLAEAFDRYIESLVKTEERRQLWVTETKGKILEVLKAIEKTFEFEWSVQLLEDIKNYQTINLSFANTQSGLEEILVNNKTGRKRKKSYIKHGGYLAFCQSYNGKINVIIGFPDIEIWVLPMEAKVIATVEPSHITEELITEYVVKFLQTMTEWEGEDRLPIGFK